MGKRVLSLFLAVFLCFQALSVCVSAAEDAGSPKHIPRVVSIVFDDSGSMYKNTDRWAYTSYAMQSFAAMMGSEDVLYITYLNGPAGTVKVDLSDSAKPKTVSGFSDIVFGGGTPNRVRRGADCLTKEYATYGDSAKYYLVVMADGELDSGEGVLSESIRDVTGATKTALGGADFQSIYFSMKSGDKTQVDGVSSHFASTSDKIVSTLKDVSADIMGRTAVSHEVSGNTLSFTLKYPALSIAVFAQKQNGDFASFQAAVQKDGKALSCQVGNYSVKCPTKITKNTSTTVYKEKVPTNPPAGVVSLITNSGNPLAKGTYTVDISGYDLKKDDVVVLVEPAVRIGCQYFLNNDDAAITFEELKKRVSEGDTVTVECGLYEMNPDGSAGDAVPLDVLSPEYKILVNGKQVGIGVDGAENAYSFQVDKSFENQEMKVQALLKGYQPFVMKETFGELSLKLQPIPDPDGKSEIGLTKPLWKQWSAGEAGIRFELEKADASVLARTAIAVEGCEGLPVGICSALGNAVRLDGNAIVYLPVAQLPFGQLPDSFKVSLTDLDTNGVLTTKTVRVIRPVYRFEIENQLEGAALSLEQLKENSAAIRFILTVDYDGSGQYIPVSQSDCEGEIPLTPDTGVLPGQATQEKGSFSFVPHYDPAVDTQLSAGDLVGKSHSLSVTAQVDGQQVQSDTVSISLSSAAYRLEVENEITQPLTLDTVKTNSQRVIFRLLADYDGSGNFGELAQWDAAALEQLQITTGELPGKLETVYDAGGKPVGKAFIAQYDENNNNGVPFTAVAGKVHEIIGTVQGTELSASTTVEVLAPDYEIVVREEGVQLTNTNLHGNRKGVAFTITRDGRQLTVQELSAIAPYDLTFDVEQPWLKVAAEAKQAEDGSTYLLCMPQHDAWGWLGFFTVKLGQMHIIMTLGEDTAAAELTIVMSKVALIVFLIVLAVLALILWMLFCAATTVRFVKGSFCKVSFNQNENGKYMISSVMFINPGKTSLKSRIKWLLNVKNLVGLFIPFKRQSYALTVSGQLAHFIAKKPITRKVFYRTFPVSPGNRNQARLRTGRVLISQLEAIVRRDGSFEFDPDRLRGKPHTANDETMHDGQFLTEENCRTILLYLTRREQRELAPRRGRR